MKHKSSPLKKLNLKNLLVIVLVILVIILFFAFFDYLTHLLSEEYLVPQRYFTNKIIYGTIFGFIAYLLARKQTLFYKSLIFSAVVAVLLQIRYFLEGYTLYFVFLFLAIHFIILWPLSWVVFKFMKL